MKNLHQINKTLRLPLLGANINFPTYNSKGTFSGTLKLGLDHIDLRNAQVFIGEDNKLIGKVTGYSFNTDDGGWWTIEGVIE